MTEWARIWALTAYDVVVAPVISKFKRGWELGKR